MEVCPSAKKSEKAFLQRDEWYGEKWWGRAAREWRAVSRLIESRKKGQRLEFGLILPIPASFSYNGREITQLNIEWLKWTPILTGDRKDNDGGRHTWSRWRIGSCSLPWESPSPGAFAVCSWWAPCVATREFLGAWWNIWSAQKIQQTGHPLIEERRKG